MYWYLHDFSNVGIPLGSEVEFLSDEVKYFTYDDMNMFYAGLYLALNGEYDDIEDESICPFTGLVADIFDMWTGDNTEDKNYYNWHPIGECYKISQEFDSNLGQAIQYIYRSGSPEGITKHENTVEDLQKAINFIQYEIERITNNEN